MAPRYQKLINIPISVHREAPEVQSLLLGMSVFLKTILLSIFLYITWANVKAALGRLGGLGRLFPPASLSVVLVTMGVYIFKLRRYRV